MTRLKYIIQILTVAFLLLWTVASATAQGITVYAGQPFTFEVSIPDVTEENITWEIYSEYVGINMAVIPGNCPTTSGDFMGGNTGSSVQIVWYVPGVYIVKVRGVNACPTDNMKFYMVTVLESLPVAILEEPGSICQGDGGVLEVNLSGTAPWDLILFDGVNYTNYTNIPASPFVIPVNPNSTTTYTITQVSNIDGTNTDPSNTVTLIVLPRPVNSQIYQYSP